MTNDIVSGKLLRFRRKARVAGIENYVEPWDISTCLDLVAYKISAEIPDRQWRIGFYMGIYRNVMLLFVLKRLFDDLIADSPATEFRIHVESASVHADKVSACVSLFIKTHHANQLSLVGKGVEIRVLVCERLFCISKDLISIFLCVICMTLRAKRTNLPSHCFVFSYISRSLPFKPQIPNLFESKCSSTLECLERFKKNRVCCMN